MVLQERIENPPWLHSPLILLIKSTPPLIPVYHRRASLATHHPCPAGRL